MTAFIDRTGLKYGRLTAISRARTDDRGYVCWLCLCDCGKTKEVTGINLGRNTRSCGCLKIELQSLPPGRSITNRKYKEYSTEAKERNYEWGLSFEEFDFLVSGNCDYCGSPPSSFYRKENTVKRFNGIDRVDNTKGYIKDNCVSCCKDCNIAKRNRTTEEFIERCCKVAAHSGHRIKETK